MTDTNNAVPWSFSKLKTYEDCAARYLYKYIEKLPDSPPGPAAQRGIDKHNEIEKFIKGYGSWEIPPGPESIHGALDRMRASNDGARYAEMKVGYDEEWYPVGYKMENTWARGVLDAVWHEAKSNVVDVYEWKTGKPSEFHAEQRQLYGIFALKWWNVPEVTVTTVYLDETAPNKRVRMKDTALPRLQGEWNARVVRLKEEKTFAPNPGQGCRWCVYSRYKGGPCKVA
jgi:hypothetical protein